MTANPAANTPVAAIARPRTTVLRKPNVWRNSARASTSIAVAVCAALLARRRPAYGIALLVVLDPFAWAHDLGPTQITLSKAALLGVLVALVLRRSPLAALRDPAARPLLGGALAIVVVTAFSAIPATYIDAVARETLKAIEYALAFGAAAVSIASETDEDAVRACVVVASALACASALVQYVTGAPSGTLIGGHVILRIAGLLEGPNQLAGYLDLAVPILLASALARGRYATLAFAVLALAVVTDVLTLSRSGLFGMVAGVAFVLVFRAGGTAISARFATGVAARNLARDPNAIGQVLSLSVPGTPTTPATPAKP